MSAERELPLAEIRLDGGTQAREANDQTTVDEYAAWCREGRTPPPVDVFHDGKHYWCADGFHRVLACLAAGLVAITARVHRGTQRDARLFACGANAGLRRTNADKRKAVAMVLADEEWRLWPNVKIAAAAGVGDDLVKEVRAALYPETVAAPRKGADGKTYGPKKPRAAVAKTPAAAPPQAATEVPAIGWGELPGWADAAVYGRQETPPPDAGSYFDRLYRSDLTPGQVVWRAQNLTSADREAEQVATANLRRAAREARAAEQAAAPPAQPFRPRLFPEDEIPTFDRPASVCPVCKVPGCRDTECCEALLDGGVEPRTACESILPPPVEGRSEVDTLIMAYLELLKERNALQLQLAGL